MAASVSTIGYGDTLEWSTDGGNTWTAVSELKTCDLPTHTVEKIDRTHMGSPNRTKEYTVGLRDTNDCAFTFNFNSTDYDALYTRWRPRTERPAALSTSTTASLSLAARRARSRASQSFRA